jgi:hypothetical protein
MHGIHATHENCAKPPDTNSQWAVAFDARRRAGWMRSTRAAAAGNASISMSIPNAMEIARILLQSLFYGACARLKTVLAVRSATGGNEVIRRLGRFLARMHIEA